MPLSFWNGSKIALRCASSKLPPVLATTTSPVPLISVSVWANAGLLRRAASTVAPAPLSQSRRSIILRIPVLQFRWGSELPAGTAAASSPDKLLVATLQQLHRHEQHDRKSDDDRRGCGNFRCYLQPNSLPHLFWQCRRVGSGDEDRDHYLVERSQEGEQGCSRYGRGDNRQGDAAQRVPGARTKPQG